MGEGIIDFDPKVKMDCFNSLLSPYDTGHLALNPEPQTSLNPGPEALNLNPQL